MTTILRTAAAAGAPVAAAADAVVGAFPGAARRQRSSLRHTAHRPYPLSPRPWVMGQTWENLLFAHWPVGADQIRDLVPRALDLDLFDGSAWRAVTPFQVRGTRPRGALPPPVLSSFPELNVRTYVTLGGRPGIWFFSLDAGGAAAGAAARRSPPRGCCPPSRSSPPACAPRRARSGSTTAAAAPTRAARRRTSSAATGPPAGFATRPTARSRRGSSSATASTRSTAAAACSSARSTTGRGPCRTPTPRSRRTRWPPRSGSSSPAPRGCSPPAARTSSSGRRSRSSRPAPYMPDAIVIGAGPNGLLAANVLADRGWEVLVLEAAPVAGGAVRSAPLTGLDGFVHDVFSAFYPFAVASPAIRRLDLEAH